MKISAILITFTLVQFSLANLEPADEALERFVEQQIKQLQHSARLQLGDFPELIEKVSLRLVAKVHSKDAAIISGLRHVIEGKDECSLVETSQVGSSLPAPTKSMHRVGPRPRNFGGRMGLSGVLDAPDNADNPHIVMQDRSPSKEFMDHLRTSFKDYVRTAAPGMVFRDTYALALEETGKLERSGSLKALVKGSKLSMSLLRKVLDNLTGETNDLTIPFFFLEQVPLIGALLRKLKESHSNHISTVIRATRYAVKIANYIAAGKEPGITRSELRGEGVDLLRRTALIWMNDIVDLLVKVDESSSPSAVKRNMVIRLTHYILSNCLSTL